MKNFTSRRFHVFIKQSERLIVFHRRIDSMKRILCTILTLACSVVLTACGASSTSSEAVTYGFLDETLGTENYAIGKILRDARVFPIIEGTAEMQQAQIAAQILGRTKR